MQASYSLYALFNVAFDCLRIDAQRMAVKLCRSTPGAQAMLQQLPEYTQCYLRLACIAHLQGRLNEAISWVQQGLQRSPDSADTLCLLGASQGKVAVGGRVEAGDRFLVLHVSQPKAGVFGIFWRLLYTPCCWAG